MTVVEVVCVAKAVDDASCCGHRIERGRVLHSIGRDERFCGRVEPGRIFSGASAGGVDVAQQARRSGGMDPRVSGGVL